VEINNFTEINTNDLQAVIVLMKSLIYDRTQGDVDYALSLERENVYTAVSLKGAYNISDRNRVGVAAAGLREALRLSTIAKIKSDWAVTDIVGFTDNTNVLICLKRAACYLPLTSTIQALIPQDLDAFTFVKANNVERVLLELYSVYSMVLGGLYCGDGYASDFDAPDEQIFDNYWSS
jgi:hypothetical protein